MNFIYFNWIPILFPLITGFFMFKYFEPDLKVIFFYVCFGTFVEVLTRALIGLLHIDNTMPLVHLALLISYLFLLVFYKRIFKGFINKVILNIVMVLFIAYWSSNSLFFQSIYKHPSLPISIGSMIITILSIVYFYKVMLEAKIEKLANEPLIWINTAILIYFSANLFFYILFNLILEYSIEFSRLTVIYFSVINGVFYILIAIGFLKAGKQKTTGK